VTRILRGLGSCRLPCGCLIGIYETYDGRVISIIDAHGDACTDRDHGAGRQAVVQDRATSAAGA
jgi:hypothetical protein